MSRSRLWLILISLLSFPGLDVEAQQKQKPKPKSTQNKSAPSKTTPKTQPKTQKQAPKQTQTKPAAAPPVVTESGSQEQKIRDMIAFLEYVLNTLGSGSVSPRDKDVLVTESYAKIFRDSKVQVEDDLDEEREVITNKDVQAYLKDVDFFYRDVKFTFEVSDIKSLGNIGDQQTFKVSLTRNLHGTGSDGKVVNNTMPRFVEVNVNPSDGDLKIVSIYTNQFNESEAMMNWWRELSYEWQAIFRRKLNLPDSAQLTDVRNMMQIDSLDLSNNQYIQNIEPLSELSRLKYLNISGTPVFDLSPIRNLTEITHLDISHSKVLEISPLRYTIALSHLEMSGTEVGDISMLQKMPLIKHLGMAHTRVSDLTVLNYLPELVHLDISKAPVSSLAPIENALRLTRLDCSATRVTDLSPLHNMTALTELNADSTKFFKPEQLQGLTGLTTLYLNYTQVATLEPLKSLPKLERVYCDHTRITAAIADAFMAAKKSVLVIFDSEDMMSWWGTLPDEWKQVLQKYVGITDNPRKEQLARFNNLDSLNIADVKGIENLEPIGKMPKLRVLVASGTGIKSVAALKTSVYLRTIDISHTDVSDLSPLAQCNQLKVLYADNSKVQDLTPLVGLKTLERIYADDTGIHDIHTSDFLARNPKCLVVYKSYHVNRWWTKLPDGWKKALSALVKMDEPAKREQLHQLVEMSSITISESSITDLEPLAEFVSLDELHLTGTQVIDLSSIVRFTRLKTLQASNCPVRSLEPLMQVPSLVNLDISNTPVSDLKPISTLQNLKSLNLAGTQVSSLKYVEPIKSLESLDCSNTGTRSLDPVWGLSLKSLKVYNTSVSSRKIQDYKAEHPDCNVVYYR